MQKVEKVLVRMVVLGVVGLLLIQLVLARAKDPVDFYLAFAQTIETIPLEGTNAQWEPNLELTALGGDASRLKVLVNEREVGTLNNGKLSLKIQAGDRLAVDARLVAPSVRLTVTAIGQDLAYPKLNQVWPLRPALLDLGQVKHK